MLSDIAERESRGETHETSFGSETRALAAHLNLLFTSPNVHHLNLNDGQGCARLVRQLVQLDRVPAKNPIAGLLLLRQAWNEFDVVVHLSASYKFWSKVLYIVQLAFAWLLVVATTARNSICSDEKNAASEDECHEIFETGIFFAAATASFILFLDNTRGKAMAPTRLQKRSSRRCCRGGWMTWLLVLTFPAHPSRASMGMMSTNTDSTWEIWSPWVPLRRPRRAQEMQAQVQGLWMISTLPFNPSATLICGFDR